MRENHFVRLDFPGAKTLPPPQQAGSSAVFSGVVRRQNRRGSPDYPDEPLIPATSRHLETDKSCPSFPGSFFPHFPPHRALTNSSAWQDLSGNNLECPDRGTRKEMIYVPWILRELGFSSDLTRKTPNVRIVVFKLHFVAAGKSPDSSFTQQFKI